MFFLPRDTRYVIRDRFFIIFAVFLLTLPLTLYSSPLSYAQDDFSSGGNQDVSVDAPTDSSNQGDEGAGSQAEDQAPSEDGSGEAAAAETGATEGGSGSPSLNDLASLATQEMVACSCDTGEALATYNQAMRDFVAEVAPQGALQNEITNALISAPEGATLGDVFSGIQVNPNLSYADVAAAIGGAMPEGTGYSDQFGISEQLGFNVGDVGVAGLVAGAFIDILGGSPGDIMGGTTIALETASGGSLTREDLTTSSINVAGGIVGSNTPDFASAAFATGNSWGVDPFNVQTQLTGMGISQENIISGAIAQGVDPGRAYSNPQAAAPNAQAPIAEEGPVDKPEAAPAPAGALPPAPVQGPAPAPPATDPTQATTSFAGYTPDTAKFDGTPFAQGLVVPANDGSGWSSTKWEGGWTKTEENKSGVSYSYSVTVSSNKEGTDVRSTVEAQAFAGSQASEKKSVDVVGPVQTSFVSVDQLQQFMKDNGSDLPKAPFEPPRR